jgi:xanthine/uracil permease
MECMRADAGRVITKRIPILIGLIIGSLIVLPISLLNHNLPFGMVGSVLLGMPIAMSLQDNFLFDASLLGRKKKKFSIGSFLLMCAGALLFIIGISGMLIASI